MSPVRSALLAASLLLVASAAMGGEGDVQAGAKAYRACTACHSLAPGRHMTGPSLAGMWERKAGSAEGFTRYSDALKSAAIVWDAATLDPWLADPRAFIPGNRMTFPGIRDARTRADLIAYLQQAGSGEAGAAEDEGGMMGMMSGDVPSLKQLQPNQEVTAIRYCGDTYNVTTANGETVPFWERNLRFKTDSSADGPEKGKPALLPAGMMGDRASVIFAAPPEISALIESKC
ncbi:MAG: c-type cytochrome [Dongiaceae bacterium]